MPPGATTSAVGRPSRADDLPLKDGQGVGRPTGTAPSVSSHRSSAVAPVCRDFLQRRRADGAGVKIHDSLRKADNGPGNRARGSVGPPDRTANDGPADQRATEPECKGCAVTQFHG